MIFMNVRFCRLGIAVAGNNTSVALLPIPTFDDAAGPGGWTTK
ncbi:hypothetical protein I547_7561 [Mycobacterium kansasii 824]|uniref:Uncharacterized protein n=1 Tax=Mycobacterium kansasii TaxID=1768 RepID=A0A1V3WPT5_MYCKA|nr:hypothetical protein I547_7561 [Mycobacterium kansasii 824]OOK68436.1 hypothetical protein BZL29_6536 [Mycobacterium kansasii]